MRLPWSVCDGTPIRLKQSKTWRARHDPCRRARSVQSITILVNHHGRPWLTNTFGHGGREACRKARITGPTFHGLGGTAIARLSLGCTVPEIAAITGHKPGRRGPHPRCIRKLEANILGMSVRTASQTGGES